VVRAVRDKIKEDLPLYFHVSKHIYSYTIIKEDKVYESEHEGVTYKVTLAWAKSIRSGDIELYSFYSLFFKQLMKKMQFERLGRNCFNPAAAVKMNQHNLEIWPGFYSAMQKLDGGALIQIDLTNKIIRQDSVLSYIQELEAKGKSREFINSEFKFRVVVTSYGKSKHTYKIERIDFDKSPESTFTLKDGTEISYGQYYQKTYNINVREHNQPILISKSERTG
jgi:aubergine-like protein